ncbi:MAG: hypothetical protein V9F05_06275 [Chitinophagaceae bacterium]
MKKIIIIAIIIAGCSNNHILNEELKPNEDMYKIADNIVNFKSNNTSNGINGGSTYKVVNLGHSLQNELSKNYNSDYKYKYYKINGDAKYPIGDNSATCILVIYNIETDTTLSIRLKYQPEIDKYHILGYF